MDATTIRTALPAELDRIRAAYVGWGYGGGALADDVIYVAEQDGLLLGVVRETHEHGEVLLRGMQVAPAARGRRIGARLLRTFVEHLGSRECYCVPYSHLLGFYSAVGFEPHAEDAAPEFLRRRVETYRREGRAVLLMRRPPLPGRRGTSNLLLEPTR